jgi:hypothetical protein
LWARVRDRFLGHDGRTNGAPRPAGETVAHYGGPTR